MTDAHTTMPFNMEKLTDEARAAAAAATPAVRQRLIETLIYPSPLFKDGNTFIGNFHRPVNGGLHGTGKIGGLLGPSRVGKSAICSFYRSHHPGRTDDEGEIYPVVYFQASDDMTPRTMVERICDATGARSLPQMKVSALIDNCIQRLVRARTELLIIDDAQFMFMGRRTDQVRSFKSFIKLASDSKAFNVLLVGEEVIGDVIEAVDYLVGRGGFPSKRLLPLGDTTKEFEQFTLMLEGIDNRLPFVMKSGLADPKITSDIHRYSGGLIGRVMNLVQAAAFEAINAGTSKIMIEHLRSAATMLVSANDSYAYFR
ncbi:hypothetical protein J2857_001946 [Neorhizobium galegae]|uniref:TniB family NTP-binding protein n=1 Tax=Neorhizobium galegae TaxID=399 RepID=UPI001AE97FD0|nr:TniB family NTP-binding protein [Neorhizobium galegae]MBP2559195.1 hypothetical protein [Neorhizobium galegae]